MKIRQILIVGLITAALLGIMEIACRIFWSERPAVSGFHFYIHQVDNDLRLDFVTEDPLLMWSLKPGYQSGYVSISSQGFRAGEYEKRKPAGIFRILCLGDSSTFGYQMPLALTYHQQLEDRLNREAGGGGRRYEVINAGVVGYTALQGLVMYLSRGAEFTPDLVTAYFGVNEPICRFYLNDAAIMKPDRPQWLRILVNKWLVKSDLVRWVQKIFSNLKGENGFGARRPTARVSAEDYRNVILRLQKACESHGARLLLISPALRTGRDSSDGRVMDIIRYRKILEKTAAEAGIALLTVPEMTEYAVEDPSALFLAGDSVHPSQAGHLLIMQRLYDFIISHGLLNEKQAPAAIRR